MEEILIQNPQIFSSQHQLQLAERLGFGIHGIIFVAEDKSKAGKTALKVHRSVEPYLREREVYERLRDAGVSEILGFNVPQLIRFDDELRIIEMSIVARRMNSQDFSVLHNRKRAAFTSLEALKCAFEHFRR